MQSPVYTVWFGLDRSLGHKILHRSFINVTAKIVAHNQFMNAVDRVDQNQTIACERWEKQLSMTILGFVLDMAVLNATFIYESLHKPETRLEVSSTAEVKGITAEHLVKELQQEREARRNHVRRTHEVPVWTDKQASTRSTLVNHILVSSNSTLSKPCYFCKLQPASEEEIGRMANIQYLECEAPFHPMCLVVYHRPKVFKRARPDIYTIFQDVYEREKGRGTRKRKLKHPLTFVFRFFPIKIIALRPQQWNRSCSSMNELSRVRQYQ